MNLLLSHLRSSFARTAGLAAVSLMALAALHPVVTHAQAAPSPAASRPVSLPARIQGEITGSSSALVAGTVAPPIHSALDTGRMDASTPMRGVSLVFQKSAAQQEDLRTLLTALHDPASPQYHKWLTPDQFGARFGLSTQDIDKASRWLRKQGFTVNRVSRSRDRIFFSGTVAQIESTFRTEMHTYQSEGIKHFSPSTELSVPAALSGLVAEIGNLDDFRPQPMLVKRLQAQAAAQAAASPSTPKPAFTDGTDGTHYTSPGDLQLIYDLIPSYQHAMVGQGQAIAILGESSINLQDIQSFQAASQVAINLPTPVLVPLSGEQSYPLTGDETESDIDLEWSSTMATSANIFFVFTGDNSSYNVFNSLEYAVDTRIAPIVSLSYGGCEPGLAPALMQEINSISDQAVAQGQTLIAASGDEGASSCYGNTNLTSDQQAQLAVSYPASNPDWLAVGGTEFNEGGGNYWTPSTNGQDVISSAISYIPEKIWNDILSTGQVGAGGGGTSILFPQPAWQASLLNTTGSDNFREVPDIALASSYFHDPLLACSEDSGPGGFWQQGQESSCTNGFRDQYSGILTAGGGTSFAAPIFAGILAVINQSQGSTGDGIVASTLYPLASNAGTYASAFHDIVSGDNKCDLPSFILPICTEGAIGYSAGTGYDEASGLGSVDAYNLMTAWPSTGLQPGYVNALALSPSTGAPITTVPQNTPIQLVAFTHFQGGDGRTMTGSLNFLVDGQTFPATFDTTTSTYALTTTFTGDGNHVVVASYSGDDYYSGANNTLLLNALPATTTNITASSPSTVIGTAETFSISINPSVASPNFATGTVNILIDGQPTGSPITVSNSAATFPYTFTTAGSHTVEADYSGDANFSPSTGTTTVTVAAQAIATTTAVSAATTTPAVGVNDPLTITVTPASGTASPTGNITVTVDGTALGVTPALVNGTATVNYTFTTTGQHAIVAKFVPQGGFATSQASLTVTAAQGEPALVATTTSLTASSSTTTVGAKNNFTVTVTPSTSLPLPSATLAITVDGTASPTTATLSNGTATFTLAFTTAGTHTVAAAFAGDSTFAASSGSATVTVQSTGFALSANNLAIQQGSSGTSTVTITPANGYTGTIAFQVTPSGTAPANLCFSLPNATVSGGSSINATLSVSASTGSCGTTTASIAQANNHPESQNSGNNGLHNWPAGATILAGLAFLGCAKRRSRQLRALLMVVILAGCGLLASGCGGSSKSSSATFTPKGTYTLTVIGTDTASATITSSTTLTVTVQ